MEKTFQLTDEECMEARDQGKLTPRRTFAPSLILLGLGLAALGFFVLWVGVDRFRIHQVYALTATGLFISLLGVLAWGAEGRRSETAQRLALDRMNERLKAFTTFRVTEDGWSLETENKTDVRNFKALREYWEKNSLIIPFTDIYQVLPKRIFSGEELQELRRMFKIEFAFSDNAKPITRLDYMLAWFEYIVWQKKAQLVSFILLPVILISLFLLNESHVRSSGSIDFHYSTGFMISALSLYYLTPIIYGFYRLSKTTAESELHSISDTGFLVRAKTGDAYVLWSKLPTIREGKTAFLCVTDPGRYFALPLRCLTSAEIALVRSKKLLLNQ
jgi:hypothetical protein